MGRCLFHPVYFSTISMDFINEMCTNKFVHMHCNAKKFKITIEKFISLKIGRKMGNGVS